jgi:hypothetical protein
MRHHSPYPLVCDADVARHGVDRHLPGKEHHRLFEKQGESTARSRPRDVDSLEAMFRASHSGHPGFDKAVMLEEVEMTPAELREIMRLTSRTARRARATATMRQEVESRKLISTSRVEGPSVCLPYIFRTPGGSHNLQFGL